MNALPEAATGERAKRSSDHMLFRFCLYGFLKNQRYFEPFFMLALLSHGLNFFQIGLLYACRSLTLNLLEVPSGVIADQWGRRGSMIGSFVAYIISFMLFAFADNMGLLVLAMVLYGVGDSFRTGTHKAMIFQWLKNQGREAERTKVYGVTRSWSQYGSASSALIAAVFVISSGDYRSVFLISALPYLLNIFNFLGYPATVDGATRLTQTVTSSDLKKSADEKSATANSLSQLLQSTLATVLHAVRHRGLRELMVQSMAWEGVFGAIKDYLQPALLAVVLVSFVHSNSSTTESLSIEAHQPAAPQVVLAISLTYTLLFLLSGWASRASHTLVDRAGSHSAASRWLWWVSLSLYALLGICDLTGWSMCVVGAFVSINILQNVWRPILVSRFDDHSSAETGATILSIESQSQRLATLVVAPLVGLAIDTVTVRQWPGHFWPIAIVGATAALAMILLGLKNPLSLPTNI